ncbi:hypothetical protein Aph01nite_21120 [Acrocarpospora phusangensis]|uniref:5-bromo-4-chloroindolyl phosphate hydrolysis protein n=1 Tax=Acrocarpospora phusangensis TaxID=1070424 RepID=A0A919QCI9_9ACTN|nr:hypothetical protein [Acrocarpospora phusangensis]GIH23802.1 hypothetical protein Aph01nite_21120 [Acrocarpospora phusangensis]
MATSNRVLTYLGSTRNITGSILALIGVGLVFAGVAGAFWPIVVAGLYGIGALLAPADRTRVVLSHAEVETTELRRDLEALLAGLPGAYPEDVRRRAHELGGLLREVLDRAEVLTTAPDQLHIVSQTIRDYLPTSLNAYRNLPPSRRPAAHAELLGQLDLLRAGLARVADAVYQGDEQALRAQSRFLRERFGGSELDL